MEHMNKNFFTRLFAKRRVDEQEHEIVIEEKTISTTASSLPHTLISFTPEQVQKYTEIEKQEYQQKLLQLPPLRIGDINFVPFEVGKLEEGYYCKVFIRNGRDLEEEFSMNELPLYLVDNLGEKVAGGIFRLKNFGTLKFGESRVWIFTWRPEQILKRNVDFSSFTISFE